MCAQRQGTVVLKSDPYIDWRGSVEFRLTYSGRLLGASRNDTRAQHKHDVRRIFHKQLKRLWNVNPILKGRGSDFPIDLGGKRQFGTKIYIDYLADKFTVGKYPCVPLVVSALSLACRLDILFLRYDQPGATLIQSGDIDNRLKTIFDALRIPLNVEEAIGEPAADESPLYCLLEDDKLIDHVSVSTDLLLEPDRDINDVQLVIDVKVKTIDRGWGNLDFGD